MNLTKGWYLFNHDQFVMIDPLFIRNFDWKIPFDKLTHYLSGQSLFVSKDHLGSLHLQLNRPLYGGGNQQSITEQQTEVKVFSTLSNVGGTILLFIPGGQPFGIGLLVANRAVVAAGCLMEGEYLHAIKHIGLGALAACPLVGKAGEAAYMIGNTTLSSGSAITAAMKGDAKEAVLNTVGALAGVTSGSNVNLFAKVAGNGLAAVNSGFNVYDKVTKMQQEDDPSWTDYLDLVNEGCTLVSSVKQMKDAVDSHGKKSKEKEKEKEKERAIQVMRRQRLKINMRKLEQVKKQQALLNNLESRDSYRLGDFEKEFNIHCPPSDTYPQDKTSSHKRHHSNALKALSLQQHELEVKIHIDKYPGELRGPKSNFMNEWVTEHAEGKTAYFVKHNVSEEAVKNYERAMELDFGVEVIIDGDRVITKKGYSLQEAIRSGKISKPEAIQQVRDLQSNLRSMKIAHADIKHPNLIYCPERKRILTIDNGHVSNYGEQRDCKTPNYNTTKIGYNHQGVGDGTDAKGFDKVVEYLETVI